MSDKIRTIKEVAAPLKFAEIAHQIDAQLRAGESGGGHDNGC